MSSCIDYYAKIQLYVDGELTQQEEEELLQHVADCAGCTQALQSAQSFAARLRSARPPVMASASLREAVLRNAAKSTAPEQKTPVAIAKPGKRYGGWYMAAAATVALLVGGSLLQHEHATRVQGLQLMMNAATAAQQQFETQTASLDIQSTSPAEVTHWFTSRVSFPFHMANAGMAADAHAKYQLQGGRLITVGKSQGALLMFKLPDQVVSMVVAPESVAKAAGGTLIHAEGLTLHSEVHGPLHVVTWNNRGLTYAVASNLAMGNVQKCTACHTESTALDAKNDAAQPPTEPLMAQAGETAFYRLHSEQTQVEP